MGPTATFEDHRIVTRVYRDQEAFVAAAEGYIKIIRNNGGFDPEEKDFPVMIATLRFASIHINSSWKGGELKYVDELEETHPDHRALNPLQKRALEALGILHAAGLLE